MKEKILLIDGHSILHRTFYGLPDLTNSKGIHTNAVYGFLNILFREIDDLKPDYIAVAFDLHAPTFRHKMYDGYKGTRKPMPVELKEQVDIMKGVLSACGIVSLSKEGFEADDMLGSAAVEAEKAGMEAVILSGDRDLLQLVTENITVRLPKTKQGRTVVESYDPAAVLEAFSVEASQIVDLKALMGDSSDNIPGLPGVGEKTAAAILKEYGTLENARAHMEDIKPKKAKNAFMEHYDLALLSQKLARIETGVPLPKSFEEMRLVNPFTKKAYELFAELEFKNLLQRFSEEVRPTEKQEEAVIVTDFSECERIFGEARLSGLLGFYLYGGKNVKGLALKYDKGLFYIPVFGFVTESFLTDALRDILSGVGSAYTVDLKEQLSFLEIPFADNIFDAAIAAYLVDPLRSGYSYDYIAAAFSGCVLPSADTIVKGKYKPEAQLSVEEEAGIAGNTAKAAFMAGSVIPGILKEKGMLSLYTDMEMPLVFVLSEMERTGIRIRKSVLMEISDELTKSMDGEEELIYSLAGERFNIQSPKQLGTILFEKLKLPGGKKTKTGYSTAADVLEKLSEEAPIVGHILKYRQAAKLKSTYTDALLGFADENDRIHTHFRQTVTATGRLSSTEPNLQNIPVRDELGKQIRKVFVPKEGCVFIDADYSQIELRVMASLSGDEMLINAYRSANDIHAITASEVFKVPLSGVTPEMRRNAKAVNFGIIYGISSFGLSQGLSITRKEAAEYIEQYFKTYPDIKKFLDRTVEAAKENGFTTTAFGRVRPIPELKASNFMTRSFGERAAMNSPIQGTAADIIKLAMLRVSERLKKENMETKLLLQVHDELLLEAPVCECEKAMQLLKEEMEGAALLEVPLEVEVMTGSSWYEAH